MRRARIIALVAVPVLLLGGCRGGVGAGGSSGGDDPSGGGSGGGDGSVEQQFDDVESTLSSIEAEMADDGGR
jgi:hypothetical protein